MIIIFFIIAKRIAYAMSVLCTEDNSKDANDPIPFWSL